LRQKILYFSCPSKIFRTKKRC